MKKPLLLSSLSLAVLLASCGGGGGGGSSGPTTPVNAISGTAAAGAPITNSMSAVVTIKDSSATPILKTTNTDAAGHYAFSHADIDSMTPPLMEQVDYVVAGSHYVLYSAVTSSDLKSTATATVNITPLTDLVIANIAGDIASNVFKNNTFKNKLTPAALTAGASALRSILQPVLTSLGVDASVDLFHDSFTANHTGLDQVLDAVKVTVDPVTNTASLTNASSNTSVSLDMSQSLTGQTGTTLPAPTSTAAMTDLQAIQARFTDFMNLLNTVKPNATNASLLAFFDAANFLDDGHGLSRFLQNIVDPTVEGNLALTNITIEPVSSAMLPAALSGVTAYRVNFQVVIGGSKQDYHSFITYKSGSNWLILGNYKHAQIEVRPSEELSYRWTQGTQGGGSYAQVMCTGFDINIKDPGNLVPGTSTALSYAVVTGPGLPAAGALYFNNPGNSDNLWAAAGDPSTFNGVNTVALNNSNNLKACNDSSQYPLDDTAIAAVRTALAGSNGAVYTVKLYVDTTYSANNTPVFTYQERLHASPLLNTALSTRLFPSGLTSNPTLENAAASSTPVTVTLSWTAPAVAGLGASDFWVNVMQNNVMNGLSGNVDKNLMPTDTSVMVAIPMLKLPASQITGNASINYYDDAGRKYHYDALPGSL